MAGRRKLPAAEPGTDIQVVGKTPPEIAEVEAALHAAVDAFADDEREATLLIGQRQGRKQVFDSLQKLLTVTDLEDLKQIKESNKYKGVRVKTPAGELVTVTNWSDYCVHVEGRSRETIDNDLLNYEKLGAECFDALRTLGVGPGKMRELRRAGLPADDADALVALAKAGNKDAVLELAEDMIGAHAKERAELERQKLDLLETIASKDDRSAKREREIEQLQRDLSRARRERARATPGETSLELRRRATAAALQAQADISAQGDGVDSLMSRIADLREHAAEEGIEDGQDQFAAALIGELLGELRRVRDHFGLPIANDHGAPDWMEG